MSDTYTEPANRYQWAQMASADQKELARALIRRLFTGEQKRSSMHFVNTRLHTEQAMDNFIKRLEAALAAKTGAN